MSIIDNLETLRVKGQDSALLRYSLGNEYLKQERLDEALEHLAEAVRMDAGFSAAWKLYGKALTTAGRTDEALTAFGHGIATAEQKGDVQAAKEMRVFRARAEKGLQRSA
jgi:predicted Zn-dependent protease